MKNYKELTEAKLEESGVYKNIARNIAKKLDAVQYVTDFVIQELENEGYNSYDEDFEDILDVVYPYVAKSAMQDLKKGM